MKHFWKTFWKVFTIAVGIILTSLGIFGLIIQAPWYDTATNLFIGVFSILGGIFDFN